MACCDDLLSAVNELNTLLSGRLSAIEAKLDELGTATDGIATNTTTVKDKIIPVDFLALGTGISAIRSKTDPVDFLVMGTTISGLAGTISTSLGGFVGKAVEAFNQSNIFGKLDQGNKALGDSFRRDVNREWDTRFKGLDEKLSGIGNIDSNMGKLRERIDQVKDATEKQSKNLGDIDDALRDQKPMLTELRRKAGEISDKATDIAGTAKDTLDNAKEGARKAGDAAAGVGKVLGTVGAIASIANLIFSAVIYIKNELNFKVLDQKLDRNHVETIVQAGNVNRSTTNKVEELKKSLDGLWGNISKAFSVVGTAVAESTKAGNNARDAARDAEKAAKEVGKAVFDLNTDLNRVDQSVGKIAADIVKVGIALDAVSKSNTVISGKVDENIAVTRGVGLGVNGLSGAIRQVDGVVDDNNRILNELQQGGGEDPRIAGLERSMDNVLRTVDAIYGNTGATITKITEVAGNTQGIQQDTKEIKTRVVVLQSPTIDTSEIRSAVTSGVNAAIPSISTGVSAAVIPAVNGVKTAVDEAQARNRAATDALGLGINALGQQQQSIRDAVELNRTQIPSSTATLLNPQITEVGEIATQTRREVVGGLGSLNNGINIIDLGIKGVSAQQGALSETVQRVPAQTRAALTPDLNRVADSVVQIEREMETLPTTIERNINPKIETLTVQVGQLGQKIDSQNRDSDAAAIAGLGVAINGLRAGQQQISGQVGGLQQQQSSNTDLLVREIEKTKQTTREEQQKSERNLLLPLAGLGATLATVVFNQAGLRDSLNTNTQRTNQKLDQIQTHAQQCCGSLHAGQRQIQQNQANPVDSALLRKIDAQTVLNGSGIVANGVGIANTTATLTGHITRWERFRTWLGVDRALGIANLAMNTHNAFMLSRNLAETFLSVGDIVLQAAGLQLKDSEGDSISFYDVIGNNLNSALVAIVGVETAIDIKLKLSALNRIYHAGTNLAYTVGSMIDSTRSILETVGSYTGRIGNALKRGGVVLENSYSWMQEDLTALTVQNERWQRFHTAIQNVEEVTGAVGQIAGDIVSIRDSVTQLGSDRKEWSDSVEGLEGAFTVDGNGVIVTEHSPGVLELPDGSTINTTFQSATIASAQSEQKLNDEPPVTLDNMAIGTE